MRDAAGVRVDTIDSMHGSNVDPAVQVAGDRVRPVGTQPGAGGEPDKLRMTGIPAVYPEYASGVCGAPQAIGGVQVQVDGPWGQSLPFRKGSKTAITIAAEPSVQEGHPDSAGSILDEAYGGPVLNRARRLREILDDVRAAFPARRSRALAKAGSNPNVPS